MPPSNPRFPNIGQKEWQCIYCGRYMDDIRAVRRVEEQGFKVASCVPCFLLTKLMKGRTRHRLATKQARVKRILKISPANPGPDLGVYVSNEGLESIKYRVGKREQE